MIKISYTNTIGDIIWFNLHFLLRHKFTWAFFLFTYVTSFLPALRKNFDDALQFTVIGTIMFPFSIFFMAIILIIVVVAWISLTRTKSKDKVVLTEHRLTFSQEEMIEETEFNKSVFKWNGVLKMEKTRGYIYIFISSVMAHLIPRRSFESDREYSDFFKQVNELYQNGKNMPG